MDFTALPETVMRLLTGAPGGLDGRALPAGAAPERVGLVLLDAFGRRFLERHAEHPLLRRVAADGVITPLESQFPSTTVAHVTTMHTGRPVGAHGLYEWRVFEPALDRVILPLPFARTDGVPDSLHADGLDPRALLDSEPTLYERLGVPCVAIQPASFCPSTFDRVAARGACLRPFDDIADGAAMLREELARPGRRYAYLYWDGIDRIGHHEGPNSPAFDRACVAALDALDRALRDLPGALVLLTADHGQVAVSPDRVDYLDDLWPELADHLRHEPAGSARDCFLHTVPGTAPDVAASLAERLAERAEVRLVADLVAAGWFGAAGPRLRGRLADVCVLPAAGRQAWLRAAASVEQHFRGQHGGLHLDERETWLGALALD